MKDLPKTYQQLQLLRYQQTDRQTGETDRPIQYTSDHLIQGQNTKQKPVSVWILNGCVLVNTN